MRFVNQDYQFTVSTACEKAMDRYKNEHNVVKAFLNEAVDVTGNKKDTVRSSDIFPAFEEFCRENHYYKQSRNITKIKFFKMLNQAIDETSSLISKKKHNDSFYFTGMKLK